MTERDHGQKPEVKILFHGTSKKKPENIYMSDEGFDLRLANQGLWGRALYFGANTTYCHSYAHLNSDGLH